MAEEVANLEMGDEEESQTETPTPQHFLDLAIQSATEHQMPMSELVGLFYYYTHSVCATYREDVIARNQEQMNELEKAGQKKAAAKG
jgi:hypothetical protein